MSTTLHESTIIAVASEHEDGGDSKSLPESVLIRFAEPDEDNPFNWRPIKKWYFPSTPCHWLLIYFIMKDDGFDGRTLCVFSVTPQASPFTDSGFWERFYGHSDQRYWLWRRFWFDAA